MSKDDITKYLLEPRIARVSTVGADGSPQQSPVWFLRSEDSIMIAAYRHSQKVRNIRRNPNVSVLIDSGEGGLQLKGVMLAGKAQLIEGEKSPEIGIATYAKYLPEEIVTKDKVAAFFRGAAAVYPEEIMVIKIVPEKISSWDYTKITVEDFTSPGKLSPRHDVGDFFMAKP